MDLIPHRLRRVFIPAEAGIYKQNWMPDQVRHDVSDTLLLCGGVVHLWINFDDAFQRRRLEKIIRSARLNNPHADRILLEG